MLWLVSCSSTDPPHLLMFCFPANFLWKALFSTHRSPRGTFSINYIGFSALNRWLKVKAMSDYFWKEMNFSLDNLVLSSVSLSLWRRANAQNVSLETLGGGQFTLSTQLIMTKVSCYNHPPTQHHSFFGKLPPLFINFSVVTLFDYSSQFISVVVSGACCLFPSSTKTVEYFTMEAVIHSVCLAGICWECLSSWPGQQHWV